MKKYVDILVEIMKIEFTLEGFTISIWQIMLFLIIAGILVFLIGGITR